MFSIIPYRTNRQVAARNDDYLNPFADSFFRSFFTDERLTNSFKVDVQDNGDSYLLEADMPGFDKDDVRVEINDGVMTISAETDKKNEKEEKNYVCRERVCRSVSRSFSLDGIKEDAIGAEYKDGVLKLTLPKMTEEPKPAARKIEIQ